MVDFIDDYREVYGVGPICEVLPIAPSTYYAVKARQADPGQRSARTRRDEALGHAIQQIWTDNYRVYGARKVWLQLRRDGWPVARCTVERLMRQLGLQGAVRGRTPRTTFSDPTQSRPADHVQRDFTTEAPDQLWVVDFVRHEVPLKRVEVRDLHLLAVAAAGEKLRAVRARRCGTRVDSSPDNAVTGRHYQTAWVRQARLNGVRKEFVL